MVRRRGPESGAAALETALVLPVFMTLVIGIFNLGWAFYCGAEVRHAAERATRLIIYNPATTEAEIQSAVLDDIHAADADDVTVSLATEAVGEAGGQVARISWSYGYRVEAPLIRPITLDFGSSIVVPLRS